MAKRGRRVTFHGAFKSKAKAKAKEKTCNCFILPRKLRGKMRYLVLGKR